VHPFIGTSLAKLLAGVSLLRLQKETKLDRVSRFPRSNPHLRRKALRDSSNAILWCFASFMWSPAEHAECNPFRHNALAIVRVETRGVNPLELDIFEVLR
jgi:hypothetical protein